jgi:hypothetical protein
MHIPGGQKIQGSALEAASAKTLAANAQMASAAKSLGAGQKGGKRMRGGATQNLIASPPIIPEGGTIPGVSAMGNHLKNVDNLNALRFGAVGDKLGGLQPYDPMPTKGGRRTKRHRKAKNGRSRKRTHRRRNGGSSHHRRRSSRVLLKSVGKRK